MKSSGESVESKTFSFQPIGHIENNLRYHYEAPRQAVFASGTALLKWANAAYRAGAEDLIGFDRIWLVWVFDQNKHDSWNTQVRVPVPAEKDHYSVFATRSPYRPNPIGISSVELLEIREDGLLIGACDLLNGTAVLDVKPYIPEVDAFPEARAGWRDRVDKGCWQVEFSPESAGQCSFIKEHGALDIANFCTVQLQHRPLDKSRKRLEFSSTENCWIIHCRTWKIFFTASEADRKIVVHKVASNYKAEELAPEAADKYLDKELHRHFIKNFFAK